MRKREVLAEFKKTVKLCLKNVECVFDEKNFNVSYSYIPKYHNIHYDDNLVGQLKKEQFDSFYLSLFEMKDHYFQKIFYGEPATEEDIEEIKRIERGFYDLSVLEDIIITNELKFLTVTLSC